MVREAADEEAGAMTTTPPDAPVGPEQGPRARGDEIRDLGRLRRSTSDRHVAGVAGGLGRHLDIDPVILRVAFVVLIFFGGAGLLLYGACWLLVPQDDGTPPAVRLDDRTRSIVLIVAGGLAALALVGDSWGVIGFPWPLAILGAIALVLLTRSRNRAPQAGPYPAPYAPQGYGPQAYGPYPYAAPPAPVDPAAPGAPESVAPEQTWAYGPYAGPQTGYGAQYVAPVPPNPTRRGPRLFWFTMALAAFGVGVLGIIDLAGAPVPDSAYPALVVATCGVLLVVGAFFGRAGGLIPVGLVAALIMAGTAVGENLVDSDERFRPVSALDVRSSYDIETGDLVLDLTGLEDPEALAGRSIEVEGGVARLTVIVPDEIRVRANADVGIGVVAVFDSEDSGVGVSSSGTAGRSGEALEIDADLGIGEVRIHTESQEAAR